MKILFFISNIGSYLHAEQIIKIILDKNKKNNCILLLSGSCVGIKLNLRNLKVLKKEKFSQYELEEIMSKNNFDNVFIGLTSYSETQENFLCELCKKRSIPTWTLQDYPQYYGSFSKQIYPNFFLVLDEDSFNDIKTKLPSANVLKILSPKNTLFNLSNKLEKKIILKESLRNDCRITLASQPFLPGVKFNIFNFLKLLDQTNLKCEVCLHPEQFNNSDIIKDLNKFKCVNKINNTYDDNIASFYTAKYLVTSFSTIAIDLDRGLGKLNTRCEKIYYLFEGDLIKKTFQNIGSSLSYPYKTNIIKSYLYEDIKSMVNNLSINYEKESVENKIVYSYFSEEKLNKDKKILKEQLNSFFKKIYS